MGWSNSNELYSCSDDKTIHKWNSQGQSEGQVLLQPADVALRMLEIAAVSALTSNWHAIVKEIAYCNEDEPENMMEQHTFILSSDLYTISSSVLQIWNT